MHFLTVIRCLDTMPLAVMSIQYIQNDYKVATCGFVLAMLTNIISPLGRSENTSKSKVKCDKV